VGHVIDTGEKENTLNVGQGKLNQTI